MEKNVILVVSFGTTYEGQGIRDLEAVEQAIETAFPGQEVRRAFTSGVVIRRLRERGISVDSLEEALEKLKAEKVQQVWILPTFLFAGGEYRKVMETAERYGDSFRKLSVAQPLMEERENRVAVLEAIRKGISLRKREALLLVGHGVWGKNEEAVLALTETLAQRKEENLLVGMLAGEPGIQTVLAQLQRKGYTAVHMVPLMLTAGKHVRGDLAGEGEDSWKSRLQSAGLEVKCVTEGLGGWKTVQQQYVRHLKACMERDG